MRRKRARGLFPAHHIGPLVDENGQIAVALHPLGVHLADDGLRGRTDDQLFGELLPACVRDDGDLGSKALDVLGLALQIALGDQQGEIGVLMAGRLETLIHLLLNDLPDGVTVGPDDHRALDGAIIDQLGLEHHVGIPLGKVLVHVRNLFDKILLLRHYIYLLNVCISIEQRAPVFESPLNCFIIAFSHSGVNNLRHFVLFDAPFSLFPSARN